ncbi:MAG TPA: carbamoyl-phosphate synthase large subunit [Fibrobacteraceae bacterium]|nr:carbamoyl-phosphate synthase large subunit [Fibrobacteraceae bacterium]
MPKRQDIHKILIIGSGPIVIGQACEFDYSGTQACKAIREEGYQVILVNSNPATIMTDPETADAVYIEPITPEMVAKIIEKERPDAILPTLGGQTGLNCALALHERGVLKKFNVEMIGANITAIRKAESREEFRAAMDRIGLQSARSEIAHNMEQAKNALKKIGLPAVIRPAFTLGGAGGGFAYTEEDFLEIADRGLTLSPVSEILVEESIVGWKEFEMEVMRDKKDNVVIICSIENLDAMGIHTGDSITVAPAQTLTDKEYQRMRDASIAVIREIGVETGGSNVQFAINPDDGRMVIIEMNPRVSRSSALASKATGFPIAKFAAKLAVGYTLDELQNDITKETPACFEPSIDYVVTKVPRFTFEKFPQAENVLGTQMKSVGEAMSIGRTFKESLQKALRSMENGRAGLGSDGKKPITEEEIQKIIDKKHPGADRIYYIKAALEFGWSVQKLYEISGIDPWFLNHIADFVRFEKDHLKGKKLEELPTGILRQAKEWGYSDVQIGWLTGTKEKAAEARRKSLGILPVFKTVDTCAAEFEAKTPYHYSTYEEENESIRTSKKKVVILGGGPNRIGQGIEFDYCCVHASYALQEEGYEAIMVNSNPETVSTDYDTSDKLYFEPLTREDVLAILDHEKPDGVILQFGGQTPLKLAKALEEAGAKIIGTSPASIDLAEDRELFAKLLNDLKLRQPQNGIARSTEEAVTIAAGIGYPVLVRPSFVLGGRAMMIVQSESELHKYMKEAVQASEERPVLVDKFLQDAVEMDVDCICDGQDVVVAGIMQHIEEAGIHSGDSACSLPPISISGTVIEEVKDQARKLAHALKVIGLMNIQFAVQGETVYILEVNPRASRTIPFVSKSIGVPLAKLATKVMIGKTLKELGFTKEIMPRYVTVKESVFPFAKFRGVDTVLSPEMKSTGEVMGIDRTFGMAFAKSQSGASSPLPKTGAVFVSVNQRDRGRMYPAIRRLYSFGFKIYATEGTAQHLDGMGIPAEAVFKLSEKKSPNVVDLIKAKKISLVINTPKGRSSQLDDAYIRKESLYNSVPYTTTLSAALAASEAIEALQTQQIGVMSLQEYHKLLKN